MHRGVRRLAHIAVFALLISSLPGRPALATAHDCPDALGLEQWRATLGAEWIACVRLDDLTTTNNPYTDPNSLTGMGFPPPGTGTLNSNKTAPTAPAVAGIQIHGYFADGCNAFQVEPALTAKNGALFIKGCAPPPTVGGTCVADCHHDAQLVLRIPDTWSGRLLTAGTPGIRDAFASDFILSDLAMERGWAYVSQDKGNMGANFFQDACDERADASPACPDWTTQATIDDPLPQCDPTILQPWCAGRAIAEWTFRMRQATRSARRLLDQLAPAYGFAGVTRSYAAGISNGGYQVRRAIESDKHEHLYDGGVDWEGTLFTRGHNLFTYLPTALQKCAAGVAPPCDVTAMAAVGFEPRSAPLWPYHWSIYWGLTQKVYRLALDPEYTRYTCSDTLTAGPPCVSPPVLQVPPDDPDALYDVGARLAANPALGTRIDVAANTGALQRPLITLHGDQDSLLPIRTDSDVYAQMVAAANRSNRFRYYVVAGGNHVDGQFDDHSGVDDYGNTVLRPMLPCVRSAIDALVLWVEGGVAPPASGVIPRPAGATASDLANRCDLTTVPR